MSNQMAKKKATYEDLCALPENMIGEIIDGEIIATPRPGGQHIYAASGLGVVIAGPFQYGIGGGPGGWWILDEPELHLGEHVLVPDLGGWRKTTMPLLPKDQRFLVAPDWVCEILSPSTMRIDRIKKMGIYAECGVAHMWLIDPVERTLEVFRLESGRWTRLSGHADSDRVRAEPFQEVELDLGLLWA